MYTCLQTCCVIFFHTVRSWTRHAVPRVPSSHIIFLPPKCLAHTVTWRPHPHAATYSIYGLYILCGDLSCFVILCMVLYFHSPTLRKPYTSSICASVNPSVDTIKRSLFRIYSGSVKDSYFQVSVNNTNHRKNNEIGVWSSGYFLFQLGAGRIAPRKSLFLLPGSGSFYLDDGPWGPVPAAVKCARVFVRRDCMCALARVWITGSCLLVCPVCTE